MTTSAATAAIVSTATTTPATNDYLLFSTTSFYCMTIGDNAWQFDSLLIDLLPSL